MRKKLFVLLALLVAVVVLFAACGKEPTTPTPTPEHEHTYGELIPEVPASCEQPGTKAHYHCSGCNKDFDSDKVEITDLVIPATGHTPVDDPAVAATCTTDGKTAGKHCSVCGAVIEAQQTVPATGHTPVTDPAVPATYEATGLTEGSHCSVCGAVIVAQEVIPMLVPTYDEEISIGTAEELAAFSTAVNEGNTYANKLVKLTADITLGEDWVCIGKRTGGGSGDFFCGTFDGQGHTITFGGHTVTENIRGALFGELGNGAVVKNLKLAGTINSTSGYFIGTLANVAIGNVTVRNVWSSARINATALWYSGGLIGFMENGTFETNLVIDGCVVDGVINCSNQVKAIAGFVGYTGNIGDCNKSLTITNSVWAGTIMLNDYQYSTSIGGFVGYQPGGNSNYTAVTIENCISAGKFTFGGSGDWNTGYRLVAMVIGASCTDTESDDTKKNCPLVLTNVYYLDSTNWADEALPCNYICENPVTAPVYTNVEQKTAAELVALNAAAFADGEKWVFLGEDNCPCPKSIYDTFGKLDSLVLGLTEHEHTYGELIPEVPASCEQPGTKAHYHCSGCNKDFDSDKVEITDLVIPATGHTPVTDPAVPATYEATGLTEGSHCSVCGAVIVAQEVVPMLVPVYDEEISIGTAEEFLAFRDAVNGGETYAGKTVKLTADIDMTGTDFKGIGYTGSGDNRRPFSGNFDGQGHTINITQSLNDVDGEGGLFSFIRIPENGTVTIENVHVVGTVTCHNTKDQLGYIGGLVDTVDAGKSGDGGTLNVTNCWSSVRFDLKDNRWWAVSGMIGMLRHESGLKQITVNIDSCVWDGILNAGPALESSGGLVGYTGNQNNTRKAFINVSNTVVAGKIMLNTDWSDDTGLIFGYLKGNGNNPTDAQVTVTMNNVISIGKITSSVDIGSVKWVGMWATSEKNGKPALVQGDHFYYISFDIPGLGEVKLDGGTGSGTTITATKLTEEEMAQLTDGAFVDPGKWNVTTGYYVCPAAIVEVFGAVPETLLIPEAE